MLSEDLVREIVALRRRVERLEAQEPVAGALRGPNAEIDAQGNATFEGGLNVGTATGATAGQVKASGTVLSAGYQWALLASGSATGTTFTFTVANPAFYNGWYYEIVVAYRHSYGGHLNAWRYGLWVHDTTAGGDALVTTKLTQATVGTDQDATFAMSGTTVTCTLPGDPAMRAEWALFGFTAAIG